MILMYNHLSISIPGEQKFQDIINYFMNPHRINGFIE